MGRNVTRYDEALPKFVGLVQDLLGSEALDRHSFLRDASGRLTLVLDGQADEALLSQLRERARDLTPWVTPDSLVVDSGDIFLEEPEAGHLERVITTEGHAVFIHVLENRIVGQDWLHGPADQIPDAPPIVVFASHKGGVGRSTALAVAAVALSRQGLDVLAIDMDLEAPGLGSMLLKDLPRFGSLDYFVEASNSSVDDDFLEEMIAPSSYSTGRGLIHIVPAVGSEGNANPHNVLGKIARAYLGKVEPDGTTASFLDQTRELVVRLCNRFNYDVVLIDARGGLNETSAAAILGLGANILLFGVDTPQTFSGYRYLLSHLDRFRPSSSGDTDWRFRLRMVHAKALPEPASHSRFRDHAFELFSETLYDVEDGIEEDSFNFDYEDAVAPHFALVILNDANYAQFDPLASSNLVETHMYERTFGDFVEQLQYWLGLEGS